MKNKADDTENKQQSEAATEQSEETNDTGTSLDQEQNAGNDNFLCHAQGTLNSQNQQ